MSLALPELNSTIANLQACVDKAASQLNGDLDQEQIQLYELAFCQAYVDAAQAFSQWATAKGDANMQRVANYFAADVLWEANAKLSKHPASFGLTFADLPDINTIQDWLSPQMQSEIGQYFLSHGIPELSLSEEHKIIQQTFAQFSDEVVKPQAEAVHRQDLLIPDEILQPLKDMGCFGLSVPQRFGGLKPDDEEDSVGMVIVTEELSRGSLGAAGSLITRPEIMARAILEGGTEEQMQRWLPGLATGEPLCAISVTEPNTGSDVANVALKATPCEGGWLLSGGKTWCTFAGYAESILVLARTDQEIKPPHKGLSLFVVEKEAFDGHSFDIKQDQGGSLSGRAIATVGYRGMHSFELFFDNFFVASQQLIGEAQGQGRGFYYTMRGFMGGRLQTAARACGLMRACFEEAQRYAQERKVFNKAVAEYPVSAQKFAKMGAYICACRILTQQVAGLMDAGQGAMQASLVKLLSCRAAEWVSREAMQLHGGMGYAEESAVSRYFVDARVLSIFEGAEETLAIRVVGKALVDEMRQKG